MCFSRGHFSSFYPLQGTAEDTLFYPQEFYHRGHFITFYPLEGYNRGQLGIVHLKDTLENTCYIVCKHSGEHILSPGNAPERALYCTLILM